MRFACGLLLSVCICSAQALPGRGEERGSEKLGKAELEMQLVRGLVEELNSDITDLRSEGYTVDSAERFIDAQVYFDLGHYEKSALFVSSLIEDEQFKQCPHFYC